jgi:hypothetical protein
MRFDIAPIVIWIFELPLDQEIRPVRIIGIPLVTTIALCKNSAGVGMAASPSPKLSRYAEKPTQSSSGARVEPRRLHKAVFARGDALVQQCSDFLAGDALREAGRAGNGRTLRLQVQQGVPLHKASSTPLAGSRRCGANISLGRGRGRCCASRAGMYGRRATIQSISTRTRLSASFRGAA